MKIVVLSQSRMDGNEKKRSFLKKKQMQFYFYKNFPEKLLRIEFYAKIHI